MLVRFQRPGKLSRARKRVLCTVRESGCTLKGLVGKQPIAMFGTIGSIHRQESYNVRVVETRTSAPAV